MWAKILPAVTRVILYALVAAAAFGTGYYYCASSAADARTEAVMEATKQAAQRAQASLDRAQKRAQAHAKREQKLQAELSQSRDRIEAYAHSRAGKKECLGKKGLAEFNKL